MFILHVWWISDIDYPVALCSYKIILQQLQEMYFVGFVITYTK